MLTGRTFFFQGLTQRSVNFGISSRRYAWLLTWIVPILTTKCGSKRGLSLQPYWVIICEVDCNILPFIISQNQSNKTEHKGTFYNQTVYMLQVKLWQKYSLFETGFQLIWIILYTVIFGHFFRGKLKEPVKGSVHFNIGQMTSTTGQCFHSMSSTSLLRIGSGRGCWLPVDIWVKKKETGYLSIWPNFISQLSALQLWTNNIGVNNQHTFAPNPSV